MGVRVLRNLDNGVTVVSVRSGSKLADLSRMRAVLGRCVVECPTAVFVDLGEVEELGNIVPSALASVSHRAMRDYGVPVLLYGAKERAAVELAPFRTFANVYPSHAGALLALRSWVPRWVHARVPPTPTSVTQARYLIGDACLTWGLGSLRDPARLVVSELTGNAVEHAVTDVDVTAAYNGRYLRIAVQDGSATLPKVIAHGEADPARPPPERGRGLRIMAAAVTSWGVTPVRDGKIVWALLRAGPQAEASRATRDR